MLAIYHMISPRVASQALGQSHDCLSASEANLKDMGNISHGQTTTKSNKLCAQFMEYTAQLIEYIKSQFNTMPKLILCNAEIIGT